MTEREANVAQATPVVTLSPSAVPASTYLITTPGLPLYFYVPTLAAMNKKISVKEGSPWVDWIENWPPNTKPTEIALKYHPLQPATAAPEVPGWVKEKLDQQRRGENGKPDYGRQATYNGWPLYTFAGDSPNEPLQPLGVVAGLFQLIFIDTEVLPYLQPDAPYPPNISGP